MNKTVIRFLLAISPAFMLTACLTDSDKVGLEDLTQQAEALGIKLDKESLFKVADSVVVLYESAKETTPVLIKSAEPPPAEVPVNGSEQPVQGWTPGLPTWEIFGTFQDFDPDKDIGKIDQTNLYKVLYDVGGEYEGIVNRVKHTTESDAKNAATFRESDSTVEVSLPWDFGNGNRRYAFVDDSLKQYALHRDGNTIHMAVGWIWGIGYDDHLTYGATEASFNDTTGDIAIDLVGWVDYEGPLDHAYRMTIKGNRKTHHFTVKYVKANAAENTLGVTIVGTGVSRGGENDYFLLKFRDKGNSYSFSEPRYYKFKANASEEDLRLHPWNGYSKDEIKAKDPDNYLAELDRHEMYKLDASHNLTSMAQLKNKEMKLSY